MVSEWLSVSSASASSEGSGPIVCSPLQATAMPQTRLPLAMVLTVLLLLLVPTVRLMAAEPMILPPELKRQSLGGHMDILETRRGNGPSATLLRNRWQRGLRPPTASPRGLALRPRHTGFGSRS
jgi:hypothetical protein